MVKKKNGFSLQACVINKHGSLLIFLPICMMLLGFLASLLITPEYQASATIMFVQRQGDKTANNYNNFLTTRETAKTCTEIARTDKVALNILQQYDNQLTLGEIKEKIHVKLLPETILLQVSVKDSTGDGAVRLANIASAAIIAEVKNVLSLCDARVISQAFPPDKPAVPDKLINTAVGGMVGLVLAFALIMILDFWTKE